MFDTNSVCALKAFVDECIFRNVVFNHNYFYGVLKPTDVVKDNQTSQKHVCIHTVVFKIIAVQCD